MAANANGVRNWFFDNDKTLQDSTKLGLRIMQQDLYSIGQQTNNLNQLIQNFNNNLVQTVQSTVKTAISSSSTSSNAAPSTLILTTVGNNGQATLKPPNLLNIPVYVANNAAPPVVKFSTSWSNNNTFAANHNLNTTAVTVQAYDANNNQFPVGVAPSNMNVNVTNANTVTLTFAANVSGLVVILG